MARGVPQNGRVLVPDGDAAPDGPAYDAPRNAVDDAMIVLTELPFAGNDDFFVRLAYVYDRCECDAHGEPPSHGVDYGSVAALVQVYLKQRQA
jgi:hypothetical protein